MRMDLTTKFEQQGKRKECSLESSFGFASGRAAGLATLEISGSRSCERGTAYAGRVTVQQRMVLGCLRDRRTCSASRHPPGSLSGRWLSARVRTPFGIRTPSRFLKP